MVLPVVPYRVGFYQVRILVETNLQDLNTQATIPGVGSIQGARIEPVRTDSALTWLAASLMPPPQKWVDAKLYQTSTAGPAQTAVFMVSYQLNSATSKYDGESLPISLSDLYVHAANTTLVINDVHSGVYLLNLTMLLETTHSYRFISWVATVELP